MRNYLLSTIAGLSFLGCSSYQEPSSQHPSHQSSLPSDVSHFVRSQAAREDNHILLVYDAYNTTPFNSARPFEPVMPNASVSQLEKELATTPDPARRQSLADALLFLDKCDALGASYTIARAARDEPLSSSSRVYGLLPNTIVYAFADPNEHEVTKGEQMYAYRWEQERKAKPTIESYKITRGAIQRLRGGIK